MIKTIYTSLLLLILVSCAPVGPATPEPDPQVICTPIACDGTLVCPGNGACPGGCGMVCVPWTATIAPSVTSIPTGTPTTAPTPTHAPTTAIIPSPTATITPTATATITPTATATSIPTETPTSPPTHTPTNTPTPPCLALPSRCRTPTQIRLTPAKAAQGFAPGRVPVTIYVPLAGKENGGACVGKPATECFVQTGDAACAYTWARGTVLRVHGAVSPGRIPLTVTCRDRGSPAVGVDIALVSEDIDGDKALARAFGRQWLQVEVVSTPAK